MPFFKFRLRGIKSYNCNFSKASGRRPCLENVLKEKVTCISGVMVPWNYYLVFAFDPVNEVFCPIILGCEPVFCKITCNYNNIRVILIYFFSSIAPAISGI